jgi:hypothetical protein
LQKVAVRVVHVIGLGAGASAEAPDAALPVVSGGHRGDGVPPELQQVVGGGDQAPLRAGRRSAAALEAVAAAVELRVGKDGLDHALALGVKAAAAVAIKHPAHEAIEAAVPARAAALALAGVGRDQDRHAAIDDRLHLHLVPVAGVGVAQPAVCHKSRRWQARPGRR